jgi:hypothetical protein
LKAASDFGAIAFPERHNILRQAYGLSFREALYASAASRLSP